MAGEALTDTDKMIAAAEKFDDKLAQLATQYGPDVADLGLLAARVDAGSGLLRGVASAVAALVAAGVLYRCAVKAREAIADPDRYRCDEEAPWIFASAGCGVAVAVFGFGAVMPLLNLWRWIGIVEPKVWLAGKLLGWM
jgi:hypothetical protein